MRTARVQKARYTSAKIFTKKDERRIVRRYEPFATTDGTTAAVLLLLLHLFEDSLLLNFDKISALVFSEAEPKFLDPLALLRGVSAPDFTIVALGLMLTRCGSGRPMFLGSGCIGRWWRWVMMWMVMRVGIGREGCLRCGACGAGGRRRGSFWRTCLRLGSVVHWLFAGGARARRVWRWRRVTSASHTVSGGGAAVSVEHDVGEAVMSVSSSVVVRHCQSSVRPDDVISPARPSIMSGGMGQRL